MTGPGKIVQISPASPPRPRLTDANDDDFLFRTTISDAAQGIVLANLAQDEGLSTVCTLYVNNAYGKGLSNAFTAAFTALGGTVTKEVPHEQSQTTYATELGECAARRRPGGDRLPGSPRRSSSARPRKATCSRITCSWTAPRTPHMFTTLG